MLHKKTVSTFFTLDNIIKNWRVNKSRSLQELLVSFTSPHSPHTHTTSRAYGRRK